jgi:hypothetical protein
MLPTQNAPIFFVVGPAGHGKTTVRKMICEKTALKGDSCSSVIFAILETITGTPESELRKTPKEELRPVLVALGDLVTGHSTTIPKEILELIPADNKEKAFSFLKSITSPASLSRMIILAEGSVIDGVRRPAEFFQALAHLIWIGYGVIVVWVENPHKGKVPGDNFQLDRSTIKPQFVLENSGTLDDLEQSVEKMLSSLGWTPLVTPGEPTILNANGNPALVDEQPTIHT